MKGRALFRRFLAALLLRGCEALGFFPAGRAFPHIISALAVSHKAAPSPAWHGFQNDFLKAIT